MPKAEDEAAPSGAGEGGGLRGRGRLTPDAITKAAIAIADADGLDAVSIRRIAAEIDARPMSLYGHFANKKALISAMNNEIVGEMLVEGPLPDDWRAAVTINARMMYAAYARHGWMIWASTTPPAPRDNAIKLAKQMARALATLPIEGGDIWQVQGIVNDYVIGIAYRTVATVEPEEMEEAIKPSDLEELPELATLPDNLRSRAKIERFELGLQTVLDGIERRFLGR